MDNIFASRTTANFYKVPSLNSETEFDTQNLAKLSNTGQSFYKSKVDPIESRILELSGVKVSENEITLNPESKLEPKYYQIPNDSRLMRKKTEKIMVSELKNSSGSSAEDRVSLQDIKMPRTNLHLPEGSSIQRNRSDMSEKNTIKKIESKSPDRTAASDSLRENFNLEDSIQDSYKPIHSLNMIRNSK